MKRIILADANVLYPVISRDVLLEMAINNFIELHWSHRIEEEWINNLSKNKIGIVTSLSKTLEAIRNYFPNIYVNHYEKHIEKLKEYSFPDPKDLHVIAAAIECKANFIVTNNIKDFPNHLLNNFNMEAITLDQFFVEYLDLDNNVKINILNNLKMNYSKPKFNDENFAQMLLKNQLCDTAQLFKRSMNCVTTNNQNFDITM